MSAMNGTYERRRARRPPLKHRFWSEHDEGAATAEFAVVLPVVMVLALLLMSLSRTVVVSMNCQDAAAAAAREIVIAGESADPVSTARIVAGDGTRIEVNRRNGFATVITRCPVMPGPLKVLPATVRGEATGATQ